MAAPRLAEVVGDRRALIWFLLASSLLVAALGVAGNVWSFGVLRFLQVLSIAPVFPLSVAAIAQRASGEAIGFVNSARIGAAFIGPVVATTLLSSMPPAVVYLVLAAMGLSVIRSWRGSTPPRPWGEEVRRVSQDELIGCRKCAWSTWASAREHWACRTSRSRSGPASSPLLGPSGCGKTTLLRLLAGFITPDTGRIVVDDEPIDPVPPWKRNLGMVFQHYALWPHLSVFENVAFGLRERGVRGDALTARVAAALDQVGLPGFETRRPSQLSGGQQHGCPGADPDHRRLLLLDEPLSNLDAVLRSQMRLELARLHRDVGITTIYVTHDQAEALALSTRIAVLSQGRIVQEGKPEEIYWRPRNRFVAEFVGAANLVAVRVLEVRDLGVVVETAGGSRIPVASGGHAWAVGDRGLLSLRPEALRLEEAERAAGGIRGKVAGHVFEGARQLYDVTIPGGTVRVEMITSAEQGRSFKPGDDVKIEISPETSVLLPAEP
jgi:ABC-type Fe3+/spermidine/putrescine transport system ATPase subunit